MFWKMILVLALVPAAGMAQPMDDRQRAAVDGFWSVQEECQGGIPGTAAMDLACSAREDARIEMIESGLCWGHENGAHTYMRAVPCSDEAAYETILGTGLR